MELKYHEISCPPPRRVTALDRTLGGASMTAMRRAEVDTRLEGKAEEAAGGSGGAS